MAQDADLKITDRKRELLDEEMAKFTDAFYGRSKGSRSAYVWS
jgi:hypothetical protein